METGNTCEQKTNFCAPICKKQSCVHEKAKGHSWKQETRDYWLVDLTMSGRQVDFDDYVRSGFKVFACKIQLGLLSSMTNEAKVNSACQVKCKNIFLRTR